LYKQAGNYAEAEDSFLKASEVDIKRTGHSYVFQFLADLYFTTFDYSKAEENYVKAADFFLRNEKDLLYSDTLENMGRFYRDIAQQLETGGPNFNEQRVTLLDRSEEYLQRAMKARRDMHTEWNADIQQDKLDELYPAILSDLSRLYTDMGKFVEAEEYCQRSMKVSMNYRRSNYEYAMDLEDLGYLYWKMGRLVEAEESLLTATKILRELSDGRSLEYAIRLTTTALFYKDIGFDEEAEKYLIESGNIYRMTYGDKHQEYALILIRLSDLYAQTQKYSKALEIMTEVSAIDNETMRQMLSNGSEKQRMVFVRQMMIHVYLYLSIMACFSRQSQEMKNSAFDLVSQRKGMAYEVLTFQRDLIMTSRYPDLRSTIKEITTLRAQIIRKRIDSLTSESSNDINNILLEWELRKEKLEKDLSRHIPEFELENRANNVNRYSIAGALPENSVLIEFIDYAPFNFAKGLWEEHRYISFILHAGKPDDIQMIDLGEAQKIDSMIMEFKELITGETISDRSHQRSIIDLGSRLRRQLFDPIVSHLNRNNRILLSPDGLLTTLPFEVMPLDNNGKYIIDDYLISYLSTGRDVSRFRSFGKQPNHSPAIVVADPDFDLVDREINSGTENYEPMRDAPSRRSFYLDSYLEGFPRLTNTRSEGESIPRMMGVTALLGEKVLEAYLKKCRSPIVLHLATHGFFLPDLPKRTIAYRDNSGSHIKLLMVESLLDNPMLRSGLALAGANSWIKHDPLPIAAEDGLLTAEDVLFLDLTETQLVVLSACETGLGVIFNNEGVFGLRRAFMLAGAQTVVMSLWQVSDVQTEELMIEFYQKLLDGKLRSEALRDAQLSIKRKYQDPFLWGAFICQGNFDKLKLD
jgi:CHAT domain-containing protein/tetratricopeptide (TPR) repeat protein